jgi:dTDP-glucose 4,6-dehydratase
VRVLVTGGAGFLGSHLCERLIAESHEVLCYDSLLTGDMQNLASLMGSDRFTFLEYDVTANIDVEGNVDWVLHFASPASPADYLEHPIHTLKVGALGTLNSLGLAKAKAASFFLASTSEVYGDPLVNPQPESYWGNVNPIGPRGVYDEAKRFAEAMTHAYHRIHQVPMRVARIFNTYGPRLRPGDGRAVPTFIRQSLSGEPITVHGDGSQTRSLCYVDDMIDGLMKLLHSDDAVEPVNLGNPQEVTVLELAELICKLAGSDSEIVFVDRPIDDPERRRPDISRAQKLLDWTPAVSLEVGLDQTIEWCRENWFGAA